MIKTLIFVYENLNRDKNVCDEFDKFQIISQTFFHIFYVDYRRLDLIDEYIEFHLIRELKKRILSRMLKMISNTSFSFITLNE